MKLDIEKLLIESIGDRMNYSDLIVENTKNEASRIEYASDTYSYLEGFYSPSLNELICTGLKRGKILKRIPKSHTGFKYYFNEQDEIILIEKLHKNTTDYVIIYEKHENYNLGYLYQITETFQILERIILSTTENGHTTMYSVTSLRHEDTDNMILSSDIQEYQYSSTDVNKITIHHRVYSCKDKSFSMNIVKEYEIDTNPASSSNDSNKPSIDGIKYLKERLNNNSPVSDAISTFEEMCQIPIEDDLLLYEGLEDDANEFVIRIVRQYSNVSGEYDQICMDIQFNSEDVMNADSFSFCNEDLNCDFFSFIKESEAYKAAISSTKHKIKIYKEET